MTELFAITAATNSVTLDNERQAEVAFTVSNAEERPIRGRAHLLAEGEAAAEWFTLTGEAEQNFAVAGTQQYTVEIAVPADAAAGDYFFRLNMVGVENPDEDFSEGPSVSFAVPEPVVEKKSFPWWILLVVLAVIIIAGAAAFLLTRGEPLLGVTVEVSADPVIAGREMSYTIQVNNSGNKAAKDVIIKDILPIGVSFVSASEESCALGEAGEIVSCTLAEGVGSNETAEITLNVSVDGGVRGVMTNKVMLDSADPEATPEAEATEPEPTVEAESESNTEAEATPSTEATIESMAVGQVALTVQKTGPTSAAADEEIVYLVTVSNDGPSHATDVVLTYPRPGGILGATGVSQNGNCGGTEDSVQCELGQIEAGATLPVTITVLPGPEVVGALTGIVTVTDGDGSNISSEALITQVEPATGLAIAINTSGSQALIGEPFVYTVRIWNSSPVAANNVEMRYAIPEDWQFINTDPECPQQIFAGTITLICDFGDFPADPDDVRIVNIVLVATAEGATTNNFDISSNNLPDKQVVMETQVAKAFSAVGVRLDGKTDWVELDDFNVPETFTIEMWVNPEATRNQQAFISKHLEGGENVIVLGYYNDGLSLTLRDQAYVAGTKTTELFHLALVVEKRTLSQSFVTVYQNGQVFWDQELAAVLGSDISGKPWVLGQDWDDETSLTDFYDGAIAEVRFWDHARTAEQINALMDDRLVGDEDGLIAYLPLTEQIGTTATDQTGNGHDGTLLGGPVWVDASPPMDFGSALDLDGVDDFVFLPDADIYDFARDQNFTVEFWVKPDTLQLETDQNDNDIVEKWTGSGGYPFVIRYVNQEGSNNGRIRFGRYDGTNNPAALSSTRINDGEYHHVAAVKDGDMLHLYIDGVLERSVTDTTTGTTSNNSGLYIGRRGQAQPFSNYFAGSVDELRIWNVARSPEEINSKMNQPLRGNEAGLVGYWRFDVVVGNSIYDATGNGNDGSLISIQIVIPNLEIIPIFPTPIFPDIDFDIELPSFP